MRISFSFLSVVLVAVVAISGASAHTLGPDFHPDILTDESFDGLVFPSTKAVTEQRPYLIMFYAPWCGHCKHMLPIFNNASRLLYTTPGFTWSTDSARFGVVDATANPRLAQQFKVKSYPTFFYTLNGRGFRYGGALTIQDLATNAVFLYQGFNLKSFADDITDLGNYRNVANAELPRRPLFVVCRTTRAADREDGVPHDFNTFVDSVLMQGRPRFSQYIEDEGNFNAADRPKMFRDILHKQHWLIAEACAEARSEKAKASGRMNGPNDEVLLLWSDKSIKPIAYNGPWSGAGDEALSPYISIKGSNTFRTSRQIALWVWENSYNGVEKVSTEVLAGLTKRGRLGILVVDGDVHFRTDKKYLPALQTMVQRRTAAYRRANPHYESGIAAKVLTADGSKIGNDFERPTSLMKIREHAPVQLAIADGKVFGEWVNTLGYSITPESTAYPKFFVIDSLQDTIWRIEEWLPSNGMPADLLEAAGKADAVMAADGPEIAAIGKFLAAIETPEGAAGSLRGAPTTTMGLIARYVTDYVPFSSIVSAKLGGDPILFLTVMGCGVMFIFVIIVSLRRGDDEEEQELKALRAAKLAKQKAALAARERGAAAGSSSAAPAATSNAPRAPATEERKKED